MDIYMIYLLLADLFCIIKKIKETKFSDRNRILKVKFQKFPRVSSKIS